MSSSSALNSLLSSSSLSSGSSVDLSSLLTAATGASSVGIDVTSAVDAAIYAARAPERQWQTQQTTIQTQLTALSSIRTGITNLTTDLKTLGDPTGALAQRSVSSSFTAVTAVATENAAIGSHTVSVERLATATSWYSSPLLSAKSSLGTSTFQITAADGSQHAFSLGQGGSNSLTALAETINSAKLGLTASVVTDVTGARLALVSNTTGASGSFTVADPGNAGSSWNSASLRSSSTALAASTLQISDGTASVSITIGAGDTLNSLADQINHSGLALNANVVSDANGAYLSVNATSGGTVHVGADPTMLLTQSQAGVDALLQVDGVPIQSDSNTVAGAIAGVTINLHSVTSGTQAALAVTADSSQISSALNQFVSDYNNAVSLVSSQFTYTSSTKSQGALGSDAAVRSLQSALLGLTAYSSSSTGSASLASLGITVGDDGSLSLNTATLNQTIESNFATVQNFFQGSALDGFAAVAQSQIAPFSNAGGILTADANNLTRQYNALGTDVSDFESGYIASQQTVLTTMYSNAEIALQQLPATLKQIQAEFGQSGSGS